VTIARFSPVKLILLGLATSCAVVIALALLATGWNWDFGRASGFIVAAGIATLVAFRTSWSVWRWTGPAVAMVDGELRGWGMARPAPIGDIADVQVAVGATTLENWVGVVIYRRSGGRVRLPTLFLNRDRRSIALAIRSAAGLPDVRLPR
jgi:hypothetical protein